MTVLAKDDLSLGSMDVFSVFIPPIRNDYLCDQDERAQWSTGNQDPTDGDHIVGCIHLARHFGIGQDWQLNDIAFGQRN